MAGPTAVAIGLGVGSLVSGAIKGRKANQIAEDNRKTQENLTSQQLAFQKEQQAKLDAQKEIYKNMEFRNPYESVENFYEDLTVNQQQAQFEKQMFQQQQANIMQGLQGAAGGSGVAGLAQALANQGQLASQRISASIGAQEARNQQMAARGAAAADMAERSGEKYVQDLEASRQSTLLGMEMGEMTGANMGVQQAYANQMAAGSAQASAMAGQAQGMYSMAGQFATMAAKSFTPDAGTMEIDPKTGLPIN